MPHKAGGGVGVSQEAEGVKRKNGQEPVLWFP